MKRRSLFFGLLLSAGVAALLGILFERREERIARRAAGESDSERWGR